MEAIGFVPDPNYSISNKPDEFCSTVTGVQAQANSIGQGVIARRRWDLRSAWANILL
jgi:hypothetical protein